MSAVESVWGFVKDVVELFPCIFDSEEPGKLEGLDILILGQIFGMRLGKKRNAWRFSHVHCDPSSRVEDEGIDNEFRVFNDATNH